MSKKIETRSLLFYIFLVVYSASLLFISYKINIWEDESYSIHTTSNDLPTVIKQAYYFEGQPPFYFVLLALWRHLNSGLFFARLLSVGLIGLSALFFFRTVRLISGIGTYRWMLIVFLLNPFTVWAALEIRLYALAIFLSTISMYYFLRYFIEGNRKYLYLFLVSSLIGLYTQYFFVFEIIALAFSMLIFKGWRPFFVLCLYLIPVIILFIPNLFFLSGEVKMIQVGETAFAGLFTVLHSPQSLVLGLQIIPVNIWISRAAKSIIVLLTVYAYYKLYKKHTKTSNDYFTPISLIILTTAVIFLQYLIVIPSLKLGFQSRYMAIALPMFGLTFTLFKVFEVVPRNIIFGGLAIYYLVILILIYKTPLKRYDFQSASNFINKVEYPKEPVLLYTKLLLPPFSLYYTGSNPLISLPMYKYDENYYEDNISDTLAFRKAIENISSPTRSFLLITGDIEKYKYEINMNQEMIDECLKANYKVTLDTSFAGNTKKYDLRLRRIEIK